MFQWDINLYVTVVSCDLSPSALCVFRNSEPTWLQAEFCLNAKLTMLICHELKQRVTTVLSSLTHNTALLMCTEHGFNPYSVIGNWRPSATDSCWMTRWHLLPVFRIYQMLIYEGVRVEWHNLKMLTLVLFLTQNEKRIQWKQQTWKPTSCYCMFNPNKDGGQEFRLMIIIDDTLCHSRVSIFLSPLVDIEDLQNVIVENVISTLQDVASDDVCLYPDVCLCVRWSWRCGGWSVRGRDTCWSSWSSETECRDRPSRRSSNSVSPRVSCLTAVFFFFSTLWMTRVCSG